MSITKLKNNYFILRHGESIANVKGIILSDPENGLNDYGLSKFGKKQIFNSILKCEILNQNTIIISSDFKRTRETAMIVQEQLGVEQLKYDLRLIERLFGIFKKVAIQIMKKFGLKTRFPLLIPNMKLNQ